MQTNSHLGPPILPTIRMSERFRNRHQGEVERWIANFNAGKRSFVSEFGDISVEMQERQFKSHPNIYDFHLNIRLDSLADRNQGILPDISVFGHRKSTGKICAYTMMVSKFVLADNQVPQSTRDDLMFEKMSNR